MTTSVTTPVLYALGTLTTVFSFAVILVSLAIVHHGGEILPQRFRGSLRPNERDQQATEDRKSQCSKSDAIDGLQRTLDAPSEGETPCPT